MPGLIWNIGINMLQLATRKFENVEIDKETSSINFCLFI